jgi:multidrug resistance efflux pump
MTDKLDQAPAEQASPEQAPTEQASPVQGPDPVHRFTRIVLVVLGVLFVWYMLADRYAPWTDQARIQVFVVPITPKVSGRVKKVEVVENQIVEAGALQRAEAALEIAGQSTGADTAGVKAAEANLGTTRAELRRARKESKRIERVFRQEPGAVSQASRDRAKAAFDQARTREAGAVAELERAKEQLGKGGKDNPRIRDAVAALEQARIDLAETKLYAPSIGGITNLKVDEGHYAKKGAPLMTFISFSDLWIQANFRENSLANIEAGQSVDIALDMLPGKIFKGEVVSKGYAVKQASYGATGDLMTIKGQSGWLRDAQRFPVRIHFSDESAYGYRFGGAQVDVQVYGDSAVLNALGWVWIRLMSLFSYVY